MLEKSLLSSFLGLLIIIAASNAEPVLEGGSIAEPSRFKHHVSIQVLTPFGCSVHQC
ncbi:hypothetical protein TKK_0010682 [Trichogramma kaykai]